MIIIAIFLVSWWIYSTTPTYIFNDLSFADKLTHSYRDMHLKQFSCTRIEYDQNQVVLVTFELKTRPGRRFSIFQYSSDECIDDIVKIREETSFFLKSNPGNELNNKKIHLVFLTYANEKMSLFNYNFQDTLAKNEGTSFCYYSNLEIHDILKLREFSNAKTLMFSTDTHYGISDMTIFDDYDYLEVLQCPKFFSNEAIDYLKYKFPNCIVTQ